MELPWLMMSIRDQQLADCERCGMLPAFVPEGRRTQRSIYTDGEVPPLSLATHATASWYELYHIQ
jgi:hypothetical protein